jgi:hypothetical protein
MRKNQMVMMEEFRRRKNLKDFHRLSKKEQVLKGDYTGNLLDKPIDLSDIDFMNALKGTTSLGPDAAMRPSKEECFDPRKFSLLFMESDSVTNVTSLNRVNHRRVLIFIGNGNGVVAYGKGKGIEYEEAFDHAFRDARRNLVGIDIEHIFTSPLMMSGRHNDFKIRIFPQ